MKKDLSSNLKKVYPNFQINTQEFKESINDILCEVEFLKFKNKIYLGNVASSFDIEATSFYEGEDKKSTMYAWVFGINGKCIRGRTWKEFLNVLDTIVNYYKLNINKRIIIYVHNLAYEFQFMCKLFEWSAVFAIKERTPLYAVTKNGIEFRCSYLLSGYSLEKVGEHLLKYKVNKKVGDLDYKLIRHSQTPLTDVEWGYILNDGLVVMCYIQEEIERLGNICKLPLTKTGYVRDYCRSKCLKGDEKFIYSKMIKNLTLDVNTYSSLKRAFSGGFTHANINYVDKNIQNVHSYDFTSSYPAVMLSELFPMSKPYKKIIKSSDEFYTYLKTYNCLFDCKFYNIRSTCDYENYISISKCYERSKYILNNGRVIEADIVALTLTELDYYIIESMYKWDYLEISNFYYFYKAYLPKSMIECVLNFYVDKTTLKGVDSKESEYQVAKGMLNSCYGMCVTDICRDEITFTKEWTNNKVDVQKSIDAYNKNQARFLYYAWGVWITAYARFNLFTGIHEFKNDYLYSDTDSLKVINIDKHQDYIKKYNHKINRKIDKCLTHYGLNVELARPLNIKNEVKQIGIWDYEGKYDLFKTLGAKRYIYTQNNNLKITIAGVSKKNGSIYLLDKYKNIDGVFKNFKEGLYFPSHYKISNKEDFNASGKLCHTYIDVPIEGNLTDYLGYTNHYKELSCIHMEETDYTMSLDVEFRNLILGMKEVD